MLPKARLVVWLLSCMGILRRAPLPASDCLPEPLVRPCDPVLHVLIADKSAAVRDLHQSLVRTLRPTARIFACQR